MRTITAGDGNEAPRCRTLEQRIPATFYFVTTQYSCERGSNENMNGLIRQYVPKGASMEHITHTECDRIAERSTADHAGATTVTPRRNSMPHDAQRCTSNLTSGRGTAVSRTLPRLFRTVAAFWFFGLSSNDRLYWVIALVVSPTAR